MFDAHIHHNHSYLIQKTPEVELNRHMQNFLSSVTMYLNITERYLKNEYSSDSSLVRAFKQDCSQAFDNHFAYRFLYELRNYAQHYGIPITSFNFTEQVNKYDPRKPLHDFTVIVDGDYLLSTNFNWKPGLKAELQLQSNRIDIHPHFLTMMSCLMQIYTNSTEREYTNLLENALNVKSYLDRLPAHAGRPCIFDVDIDQLASPAKRKNVIFTEIPIYLVNAVLSQDFDSLPFRYKFRPKPADTELYKTWYDLKYYVFKHPEISSGDTELKELQEQAQLSITTAMERGFTKDEIESIHDQAFDDAVQAVDDSGGPYHVRYLIISERQLQNSSRNWEYGRGAGPRTLLPYTIIRFQPEKIILYCYPLGMTKKDAYAAAQLHTADWEQGLPPE
jgi:hypothetical protein